MDWNEKLRIVGSAVVIYACIVAFIRMSGKRSTAQMNNFDWIVTVAIGSLASSGILMSTVSVFDSVLAIFALVALQYAVTLLAFYSREFSRAVKSDPRMLLYRGRFLRDQMRKERVTEAEILSAVRQNGFTRLEDVDAVVLENDAVMSVLTFQDIADSEVMGIRGTPERENAE